MVELQIIIALANLTLIVETNFYVLYPVDEWVFNDFIDDKYTNIAKNNLSIFSTWSFWCTYDWDVYDL